MAHPAPPTTAAPKKRTTPLIVKVLAAVLGVVVIVGAVVNAASGDTGGNVRNQLTLIAPAQAGGGWDLAAREAQQVLRSDKIVNNTQVVNIPGAGGTIGLNKFIGMEGESSTMMMMGVVMIGAIRSNDSEATLADVTPIARLADDYDVVVVPASSPITTMDELVEQWKADPQHFAFGGGSQGSVDQMIIAQLAGEVGLSTKQINYIAYSGGGELATSLLGGTIKASVSGYNDFSDQIETGRLRALAISAPERVDGIDLPTLKELGYDVELTNWRGIVAPPGLTDAQVAELEEIVEEMHATPEWRDALERNRWTDSFMVGEEFKQNLESETAKINEIWDQLQG